MFSRFFIERPIFATVVSVIICLAGLVAMTALPVEQYPPITPVQVTVSATYPGADSQTLADAVAAPIEAQINGVDNMLYMSSASSISAIVKRLDEQLAQFASRTLEEAYPYLILDARYEKVRDCGAIRSRAVMIAIGIDWEGRRQVLAVELANRESASSWKDFILGLKQRGLTGVEVAVSDDHAGLKKALREALPEAVWQRCYVHFLRNALDHLPRKADDDCLRELRWIYDRRDLAEARKDMAAWLLRWQEKYPKLCSWVEDNIEETLSFYRLPFGHHKHLKSTNMLERLNEEIKRRTQVVRIFPNEESCLRLIRALAVETHENWIEANRYLDMSLMTEMKKKALMDWLLNGKRIWRPRMAHPKLVGGRQMLEVTHHAVENLLNLTYTTFYWRMHRRSCRRVRGGGDVGDIVLYNAIC